MPSGTSLRGLNVRVLPLQQKGADPRDQHEWRACGTKVLVYLQAKECGHVCVWYIAREAFLRASVEVVNGRKDEMGFEARQAEACARDRALIPFSTWLSKG